MRLFTEQDVQSKVCQPEEIGQEWQDRYSIFDLIGGHYSTHDVGQPRQVEDVPTPFDDEPVMTARERRELIQRVHDASLRAIANNVEGYIADSASVVNKILEQSTRILEREAEVMDPFRHDRGRA